MPTILHLETTLATKRSAAVRHNSTGKVWSFVSSKTLPYTNADGVSLYEVTLADSNGDNWTFLDNGTLDAFTVLDSERPRFKETDGFSIDQSDRWDWHLGRLFEENIIYDLAYLTSATTTGTIDSNFILVGINRTYSTDTHKSGVVVSFEGAKGTKVTFDLTEVPEEELSNVTAYPSRKTAGNYDPKVIGR